MLKVLRILILLWMITIFMFSAQPAVQSSKMSDSLSYKIVSVVNDVFNQGLRKAELVEGANVIHYPIRKVAHMMEYAVLAILWSIYFYIKGCKMNKIFGFAVLFTIAYACTDEIHQLFVPGRGGMIGDVVIDSIGGILGSAMVVLWIKQLRKTRKVV